MKIAVLLLLLLVCPLASAEDTISGSFHKGIWNFGVWGGGGKGLNNSTKTTTVLLGGFRVGRFLTNTLEYDIEVIPAFVVFQSDTPYGIDITPFLLKWNFTPKRNVVPYFEFGAGVLFTSEDVPETTSRLNFTPQAGFGLQIYSDRRKAFTIACKYMHISNGGLKHPNPGINTIQLQVGFSWLR